MSARLTISRVTSYRTPYASRKIKLAGRLSMFDRSGQTLLDRAQVRWLAKFARAG